jgi:hypothetical protein
MSLCDEKIFVLSARQNKDFLITKSHGGLDKTKIFSSQSDMMG